MTNFIPIFPLGIVVYPGEQVNLHIFEPKYKQLIKDCHEAGKPYGIPTVINSQVKEMGTTVKITEITKEYDDGNMDIKTIGGEVFKILELIHSLPDKLYTGAIVTYPTISMRGSDPLMRKVIAGIKEMHKALNISRDFVKPENELSSYDVAHLAGMPIEDEYILLELEQELHREEFIKRYLEKTLPTLQNIQGMMEKIQMNGHFRNLKGFDV